MSLTKCWLPIGRLAEDTTGVHDAKKSGVYRITPAEWTHDGLPNPLGPGPLWVPDSLVRLLFDCAKWGLCEAPVIHQALVSGGTESLLEKLRRALAGTRKRGGQLSALQERLAVMPRPYPPEFRPTAPRPPQWRLRMRAAINWPRKTSTWTVSTCGPWTHSARSGTSSTRPAVARRSEPAQPVVLPPAPSTAERQGGRDAHAICAVMTGRRGRGGCTPGRTGSWPRGRGRCPQTDF